MGPNIVLRAGLALSTLAAALAAPVVLGVREPVAAPPHQTEPRSTEPPRPSPDPWDPAAFDAAARQLPRLRSLLISRGDTVIFEQGYNGARVDRPANIKSASKSVISALVGIAIERGHIPGVDTPISAWFPDVAQADDVRKRGITVGHLLTMRSGLEGTSNRNYGAWVTSRDWVRHVLARPMYAAPGDDMEYSTGNSHLLSAILTRATAMSTWQFANEALARPMGFTLPEWPRDPQGIYFGGNDMLMTPRQMLAFGQLYLHKGRFGDRQVIPERWVAASCDGRERTRRPGGPAFDGVRGFDALRDRQYGSGWWVHDVQGHRVCFAWGYGGQYIFLVPDRELVMVTTSSPDVSEERRGHRQVIVELLNRLLLGVPS